MVKWDVPPFKSKGPELAATKESAMAKKQVGSKPKARSALGPIAHALIQGYLGPDYKVIDMERFSTALMQALHDAYALGWKDRGEVEERPK
jgi:hypothetical protein